MGPVSKLGHIDLQIEKNKKLIPADSIITAYDDLMKKGINIKENQRVEPVLQQLQNFDPAEIEHFRKVNDLAADMASKALRNCMLNDKSEEEIKKLIKLFTDPKRSKVHGRPIYYSDIKEVDKNGCFNLELVRPDSNLWNNIMEYHTRAETHMSVKDANKLLESYESHYVG